MRPVRILVLSIIITLIYTYAAAGDLKNLDRDTWMGLYLGSTKIGYMHNAVSVDTYQGKAAYRVEDSMVIRVKSSGDTISTDYTDIYYLDGNFMPVGETRKVTAQGRTVTIEVRYSKDTIEWKSTREGTVKIGSASLPPDADLSREWKYRLGMKSLAVGDMPRVFTYNPDEFAVQGYTLNVLRRERIKAADKIYDALVVRRHSGVGDVTEWRLDDGRTVKTEISDMGAVASIESRDKAKAGLDDNGPELGIIEMDRGIPKPWAVRDFKARLIGTLDSGVVFNDSRQRATLMASANAIEYHVKSVAFDTKKSIKLPVKSKDLSTYLAPTEVIESGNITIRNKAKEIIGNEKSAYKAACKIRAWVYKNMTPSDDTSGSLAASNLLISKTGSCLHYAVLYTALARAVGIPTRITAGLVCTGNELSLHAWAESYVGGWVPFDPTRSTDFVDATHVKLAQGNSESLVRVGRILGSVKAKVIDYR